MSDHQPIQPNLVGLMNDVMGILDRAFNGEKRGVARDTGIVMFIFPYGDAEGRFNYISNGANRKDIARMMREQAAKFEAEGN